MKNTMLVHNIRALKLNLIYACAVLRVQRFKTAQVKLQYSSEQCMKNTMLVHNIRALKLNFYAILANNA
jgi:hypothetical protein